MLYCLCMLRYYVRRSFAEELQVVDSAPVEHAWVHGSALSGPELLRIAEEYSLDVNIVRDVRDKYELPRVEYSDGALYVFARSLHSSHHGSVASTPFLTVLKGSLLITLSTGNYFTPEEVFGESKLTMRNSRHVFTQLIGHLIFQYEEYINKTGAYIFNTGQRLKSKEVGNQDFIKFVTVEGDLNEYHSNLSAIKTMLERLRENRHKLFVDHDCELIEDTILHVQQLLVSVGSHIQAINSIRNAYTTISNNILNQRMKALTLLTVLITLPNVFYGMFGMNVALPYADQPWAYGVITAFTAVVVITVYAVMRRLKF
jgi:magnesium transporter